MIKLMIVLVALTLFFDTGMGFDKDCLSFKFHDKTLVKGLLVAPLDFIHALLIWH